MKKLMCAMAALTAGIAFADVVSSNVVGYNTADNTAGDPWQFIGASFECVGDGNMLTLNSLACPQGLSEGDQIQMSFCDEKGLTHMTGYEYWEGDGWVDPESGEPVGDDVGLELGRAAWFISSDAKQITTAGEVKKVNHIHVFTEPWTIVSSAFPGSFCPNSENISWGCAEGDQIQVPWCDEKGLTHMTGYEYWEGDGWVDPESGEPLDADFAIATAGKGFWFIITSGDPDTVTFSEVSPLAE